VFDGKWPDDFAFRAGHVDRVVGQEPSETFWYGQDATRDGINILRSLDERLEFLEEPGAVVEARPGASGGHEVFVVHGHDRELRERVARLLERLGLAPIILEERADRGRTIIEKFEQHALDVGFAVVLLTPDDVGAAVGKSVPAAGNRARQNVVLELGYFMASLGRARVAALCTEAVERPSDIHGLLYIDVSQDGWELRLAKEMRDAGLPVDLNRL
jgi:predicted nucleotide-binding protein